MDKSKKCGLSKGDLIRELLLKTVSINPDLFCYYVSLFEAKEYLRTISLNSLEKAKDSTKCFPKRKIAEG